MSYDNQELNLDRKKQRTSMESHARVWAQLDRVWRLTYCLIWIVQSPIFSSILILSSVARDLSNSSFNFVSLLVL